MADTQDTRRGGKRTLDRIAYVASWLAVILLVLLAVGTVTENRPGTPVRMAVGTLIHAALAVFAARPVRRYLADEHDRRFDRWTVVAILVVGVIVNEGLRTPELVEDVPVVGLVCLCHKNNDFERI